MKTARRAAGARVLACRSLPSSTSTKKSCKTCAPIWKPFAMAPAPMSICCSISTSTPRPRGYLKILRAIADFEMFWIEIDSYSPKALAHIRRHSPHPISSCETLLGLREFLPYFREQSMDVAIVDAVWNGVWQALKISAAADAFEVNIA